MAGLVPTHEIPVVATDDDAVYRAIEATGGFGFGVTRTVKPGAPSFQRGIDGVTHSPWGHAVMLIGQEIGLRARAARPDLLKAVPSPRWQNTPPGHPVPMVGGIRPVPLRYEIVESQIKVSVADLTAAVGDGEQIIIFTNPAWTLEQKVAMACEAYSWVGEPYDVFEIARWVFPGVPNPAALKVCSSLVLAIIAAVDPDIKRWARMHGLDPELVAPRDIFAYGVDKRFDAHCFRCDLDSAVAA